MESDSLEVPDAAEKALASVVKDATTTSSKPEVTKGTALAGIMIPMEQVANMIQKMREDQERLLEHQRETIVQQVLQSIQASGAPVSPVRALGEQVAGNRTKTNERSPPRPPASSSTIRLEKKLHALVQHSLAESGLDFPHVYNTTNLPSVQQTKGGQSQGRGKPVASGQSATTKQVILARRELEGEEGSPLSPEDTIPGKDLEERKTDGTTDDSPSRIPQNCGLARSPLRLARLRTQMKHPADPKKRRQRKNRASPAPGDSKSSGEEVDGEYAEFIDPVDAAFNSIRRKVDQRTLAILDKSKVLLGKMRPGTSSLSGGGFVAKLRERHAGQGTGESSGGLEVGDNKDNLNEVKKASVDVGETFTGVQEHQSEEAKTADEDLTHLKNQVSSEFPLEEGSSQPGDPEAAPCQTELLRPPSNPPETEYEWENELARQILTIYATSVKAKALGQTESNGSGQTNHDGGLPGTKSASIGKLRFDEQCQRNSFTARTVTAQKRKLGATCFLPAIRQGPLIPHTRSQHRLTSLASVHYSWEPSQRRDDGKVVINMPRVPRPIWFAGTGAVKAVWCALADGFSQLRAQQSSPAMASSSDPTPMCDHQLCEEVRGLEAKKKFVQCITTLESLLIALVRARGVDELETKLWKQLVVTCNAFASRCIDYNKFPAGLQLIKQAEHLIDNSILVSTTTRMELLAYLYDTYAHYYYRRRKPHAGLQYILKAHEIHSRQSSWAHLAKCRLHIANLLSFRIKHTEAMSYMASILEMIEENKLEEQSEGGGASAQKLCLAAVCYNNLAVEQLHLREFEAASVSSANAQRLAKLCLSYSNRWLAQFQATSDCAALAIATLMEDANANKEL